MSPEEQNNYKDEHLQMLDEIFEQHVNQIINLREGLLYSNLRTIQDTTNKFHTLLAAVDFGIKDRLNDYLTKLIEEVQVKFQGTELIRIDQTNIAIFMKIESVIKLVNSHPDCFKHIFEQMITLKESLIQRDLRGEAHICISLGSILEGIKEDRIALE